jgi:AraC-like DNA-binding protein
MLYGVNMERSKRLNSYQVPSLFEFDGASRSESRQSSDWRVRRVRETVGSRGGDTAVTLEGLTKKFGLTSSHLGRRFKAQVGVGFRTFSLEVRMNEARRLLRCTNMSIKEISCALGYRHASDFDHAFKHLYSTTPRRFRQLHSALGAAALWQTLKH